MNRAFSVIFYILWAAMCLALCAGWIQPPSEYSYIEAKLWTGIVMTLVIHCGGFAIVFGELAKLGSRKND